ncbi:uncharacterized protein K489DRAFT_80530 [Dissoconium aciculare CBS 342.82]|uniref:Uncharacterized protein n=1 Tax=Dissoconium aciculare CBS 342.82 TaxID=1314786 RepID=A0A6J3LW13_9PEZI|nr:uncharacterized protein K489DRAFT_80530 [Dissoconium aciculare CBS 342.82]KAF1818812.1 hypothetical protein K489DRAFT_80530 [Dissoconium aciculare CBS 342.82]
MAWIEISQCSPSFTSISPSSSRHGYRHGVPACPHRSWEALQLLQRSYSISPVSVSLRVPLVTYYPLPHCKVTIRHKIAYRIWINLWACLQSLHCARHHRIKDLQLRVLKRPRVCEFTLVSRGSCESAQINMFEEFCAFARFKPRIFATAVERTSIGAIDW